MGSTIWSPLAGGYLTGKYLEGIMENSRRATGVGTFPKPLIEMQFKTRDTEENNQKLKKLGDVAKELNCSLA